MPFCVVKRSFLLHESEEIFVALLVKQSFVVTKARRLSWCCAAISRANTIGDSAGDEKKKSYMMSTESKIRSDIDPENVSEDVRRELEEELEKE